MKYYTGFMAKFCRIDDVPLDEVQSLFKGRKKPNHGIVIMEMKDGWFVWVRTTTPAAHIMALSPQFTRIRTEQSLLLYQCAPALDDDDKILAILKAGQKAAHRL